MFRSAASVMPVVLRHAGLVTAVCVSLITAGCGGGNRAKDYQPDSMVAFGDDNSALASATLSNGGAPYTIKGLVYTINPVAVVPGTTVWCQDTSQTPNTKCTTSVTAVTLPFNVGNASTNPLGTGYHFTNSDPSINDVNVVTMIALGTINDQSTPPVTLVQMKQNVDLFFACNASATAIQAVARTFQLGFRNDPNGCGLDYTGARTYAAEGAHIADVQTQISDHASEVGGNTLVTIWVGQNDLYDLLTNNTYATLDAKRYQAKLLADQLAQSIKPLLNAGKKVVLIGVPDLGFSPEAVSHITAGVTTGCDTATRTDNSAAPACNGDMQKMVIDFNKTLKIGDKDTGLKGLQDYVNDGRHYAYVDAQGIVKAMALNPVYVSDDQFCEDDMSKATSMRTPEGVKNNSTILNCTGFTYRHADTTPADTASYIWADKKRLGLAAHSLIGSAAYNRAANQF